MTEIYINECTLSDESKVYDVVVRDLNQADGEDRIRFNCTDRKSAMKFGAGLELLLWQNDFSEVQYLG